jgi:protein-ribulosamine 3-kinase
MNFNDIHLEQIQFFESILFENLGITPTVHSYQMLSGGNINNAVKLETSEGFFFVKWNENEPGDFFECEIRGLELIREAEEIRVPEVVGTGRKHGKSYLILEYVSSAYPNEKYWRHLGTRLAYLHLHFGEYFGLDHPNYIGSLAQHNDPHADWMTFFIEKRLRPQAGLAFYNEQLPADYLKKFEKLYARLPALLPKTKPSLLHGDLWSGNLLTGDRDEPVLIDPAVYYGSHEAELAFTQLFGGFEVDFYAAYEEVFPMEKGFLSRAEIYNLYPLLVHLNLFGSGYLAGIDKVLRKYE